MKTAEQRARLIIFVVMGCEGDYEERSEWSVDAWKTSIAAQARVDQLNISKEKCNDEIGHPKNDYENKDKDTDLWLKWDMKRQGKIKKYAKTLGDSNFHPSATYRFYELELKS